jgi:carboxyl-terminal processing protease
MDDNKMKSRRILIAIAILGLAAIMCVFAAVAGFAAYYTFGDQISGLIADPSVIFDEGPSSQTTVIETQTPFGAEVDLNELFNPLWETRELLHEDFVEQPIDDAVLAQGAVDGLKLVLEELGVDLSSVEVPGSAPSTSSLSRDAGTPSDLSELFLPFWTLWGEVQFANLEGQISYEELMRASLIGLVDSLDDPHTRYFNPEELRGMDLALEGEYEGIGAWVDPTNDYLRIIAPMEGSPAESAGLLPGDTVIAIDGEDMTGIDGSAVISRILGPAGSTVILTIEREGEAAPFDVEIERAAIFIASVNGEILESGVAYIELLGFGSSTNNELEGTLIELLAQNPKGLILDIRNNGGGFLNSSVDVSSQFISDGVILHEVFGNGSQQTYDARSGGVATDIEMIVLMNGGSASASEILAGALQYHERAILLGEETFGKGSVQISPLLSNNQGGLRVTVAYWLTPDEMQIHNLGLKPDVLVERTLEDIEQGLDPQLEKAIELLSN